MSISIDFTNRCEVLSFIERENFLAKKPIKKIAKELGVGYERLLRILKDLDIAIYKSTDGRPNFSDKAVVQEIIDKEHFESGKSLRQIEREMKLGKTVLQQWCIRHGVTTRTRIEAARKGMKEQHKAGMFSGEKHWAFGLDKTTHPLYAWASERMTKDNPNTLPQSIEGRCKNIQKRQLENPPIGEQIFFRLFDGANIIPERQFIISPYVCDFAFPDHKVIVEIDGAGSHFTSKDVKRDIFLAEKGWTTVRRVYRGRFGTTWGGFIHVLKQLIPDLQLVGSEPFKNATSGHQYRVTVCQAYTAIRRQFNNPHDADIIRFLHDCVNRHKSSFVG